MIDFKELLQNDSLKGVLDKFDIPSGKGNDILELAMNTIESKTKESPTEMASLLSSEDNSEGANTLMSSLNGDFLSGLTSKLGLGSDIASKLSGFMPDIVSKITGILGEKGLSGLGSLTSAFSSLDGLKKDPVKAAGGMFKKLFG